MKKRIIKDLDLELFYEKLDNGLEIFIVPKNDSNNIYATFTTKYGSTTNQFKIGNELIEVPAGIAHFLEHKMFEQKDGTDPFANFNNNGANANAYTDYNQTTYLFSCPNNFEKNMEILLDFVGNPYFTDKNVEKEKGIIIQELKMYEDNQFRRGFSKLVENAFNIHPIRYQVGGTVDSVESITKEDLYKCYETFYNPSNMFIVVTGNVNPKEVIKIVKKNLVDKELIKYKKINIKEIDKVHKEKEIVKMNVTIPKVYYGIKINTKKYNMKKLKQYMSLYLDSLFDATSSFSEEMKNKKILDEDIGYYFLNTDKHLLVIFGGETKKTKELIESIKRTLKVIPDEKTFNRKKKVFMSSIVYASDNIYRINNMIINSIINNKKFNIKLYDELKDLNYNEMMNIINDLCFDNDLEVIVESKKSL